MTELKVAAESEQQKALKRRAERKAVKRKNAQARENFLSTSAGFVDSKALRDSMTLLLQGEGVSNTDESSADTDASTVRPGPRVMAAPAPMAFPASNLNRWVPIGPSAVRHGQADGRPRVSGRVKDLAISANGQRAYAATAKGGVWYTGDGGATWEPLGGWASEPRVFGGNTSAFACGCVLVSFGASAANDFVMVGSGEIGSTLGPTNASGMRGMGVLVAASPGTQPVQADPWETATGIQLLEGLGIVRMVRVPGSIAGQNGDRVIAAATGSYWNIAGQLTTRGGLFLGTRTVVGVAGSYTWAPLPLPVPAPPAPSGIPAVLDPTDLVYVGTRLFVCYRHAGVAVSDDNGTTFRWLTMVLNAGLPAGSVLMGRMSLAVNDDNNAVYVLGEVDSTPPPAANRTPVAHVWQITNPAVAAPATPVTVALAGVPTSAQLWPGQRDYDQAIVVSSYSPPAPPVARVDRVYIGGSLTWLANWNASIWAFDVNAAALVPAPGVSDQPAGTTHGASTPGLIGNAVHPDVHALRKATNADGSRQIWVGCDGGVFVSLRNGQANTFASRNVGLASIEAEFVASHPTSSHFAMLGCQDNGRQIRVGETVWEVKATMQGDGGGVIFHPVQSHFVMGQFNQGNWAADPSSSYTPPIIPPASPATDPENNLSDFYSGISAIRRPATTRARIAFGTNRIWVTDDLGSANPNTWNVLPFTPQTVPPAPLVALAARDPRPASRLASTPANQGFGVPPGGLGRVRTVKWVNPTTLLALYALGVIRYTETSPGNWTSALVFSPAMAAPAAPMVIPDGWIYTDIAPVGATNNFYLTCTGQRSEWNPAVPALPAAPAASAPPTPSLDSCFYYDAAGGGFLTTGLGQVLPPVPPNPSPIDPAYSVVVDPTNANIVYVGTVTGVWSSTRDAMNNHSPWLPVVNGLPESAVQDLSIWTDPAGGASSPRLLRAALQSRGVWEVDLAHQEPVRTYLRVHERDDRRMFPTPMKNPRRRPTAADVSPTYSPDITIRPEAPVANTPSFRGSNLVNGSLKYQLWTFQTAFRWLFPSVIPNGEWSDQFGDLVERHRRSLGMSGARRIDAALWNSVMAAALDEAGSPGVYRAPWQNALAPASPGTEIDLMESVIPRRDLNNIWQLYRERSTVDVLLHHRDTRPVAANGSFVVLLWRTHRSRTTLNTTDCTDIPAYVRSLLAGPALPLPAGWNVQLAADATPLHRLTVPLAARMPRSVAINLDLSDPLVFPNGNHVMLLAIGGSTVDPFSAVPTGAIDRVDRFVRNWPHAAARLISCWARPGSQIH